MPLMRRKVRWPRAVVACGHCGEPHVYQVPFWTKRLLGVIKAAERVLWGGDCRKCGARVWVTVGDVRRAV